MENVSNMKKDISFKLKGIELLDVKLMHPENPLPTQMNYNFNISLEHRINIENKLIVVISSIEILHEDKKIHLGLIKASCIYEISNMEEFVEKDNNEVKMPDGILTNLNSITISTVRGIMFSQFKGTFLHNAYMPIVNPQAFEMSK